MKYCCIKGCTNAVGKAKHKNALNVKFYNFPAASVFTKWKLDQRMKWINAVKNHMLVKSNASNWQPKRHTVICSTHFIGNKKSEHPLHPAYVPSIFSVSQDTKKLSQAVKKFERQKRRRIKDEQNNSKTTESEDNLKHEIGNIPAAVTCRSHLNDWGDINHSMCNLNNTNGTSCAAEVHVVQKNEINKACKANITNHRKKIKDASDGPNNLHAEELLCPGFHGLSSIKNDEEYISMTGVTDSVFSFLLNAIPQKTNINISKKTRLLITLIKLKTGLCYSFLSVLFGIHQTTVEKTFRTTILLLRTLLAKFVMWPSKATIRASMPDQFKQYFPNTRVIIDCTEIHTETPLQVKERVLMYSEYKHSYTVKYLVGCTPCGFISFVSKGYGGRTSDSFITNDCGFLNLLEPGDTILADKGFPLTKTSIENKNAVNIMPPFLHNPQFTPEEVEETYNIASVRIHIERVIQKITNFHILDKLPITLFNNIDDIVYVICALVNIENTIIKQ